MLKKLLSEVIGELEPEEADAIKKGVEEILSLLENSIAKNKIDAELFVGGSFAKGTMMRKDMQDIDIFARFSNKYEEKKLSELLEGTIKKLGIRYERIHGSRDYFRVFYNKLVIELIPSYKIKNTKEAVNITDLSFFHVNYVLNKLKKNKLSKDIILAKSFCYANEVYGAESYINGFSGYGLELLIIYCNGFERFVRKIAGTKGKIVIDIEHDYKNANEIMSNLNPSRLHSPIVLIDPTFKERNVLAALSQDSFLRLKNACVRFLKKPSRDFFFKKEFNEGEFRKKAAKKGEVGVISYSTDRQEGDIAGTKLKKFHRFMLEEIGRYFEVSGERFTYDGKKGARSYFILRTRGAIEIRGPPAEKLEAMKRFIAVHPNYYTKNGFAYYRDRGFEKFDNFFRHWSAKNEDRFKQMGIFEVRIS